MKIVPTNISHKSQIEALLDQCFGSDRLQRTSYAIRLGTKALQDLSFVIMDDSRNIDKVIASIASWPVCLKSNEKIIDMIMVGPIAVSPYHQNLGYGRMLVNRVIKVSKEYYKANLIMIGDPEYYGQFGFTAITHADWELPGPYEKHRLLVHGNMELPSVGVLGPSMKEDV